MIKREFLVEVIVFFFVILFLYAAGSKLFDYQVFVGQLSKSPLLVKFASVIGWAIPMIEIMIALMLITPRFRMPGFYGAFGLMMIFTFYIIAILMFSAELPCACGGVLSALGWRNHLIFNIGFVLLGLAGIIVTGESDKKYLAYMISEKIIVLIGGITLFSFFTVVILYAISDGSIKYDQNFTRILRHDVISQLHVREIAGDASYIAGASENQIFLGSTKNPAHLIVLDSTLSNPEHVRVRIENKDDYKMENVRLRIDSPFFYVFDGKLPGIFQGYLHQWTARQIVTHVPYFAQAIPITGTSFALQAVVSTRGSKSNQNIIGRASENPSFHLQWNEQILECQSDSLFATMGFLRYAKDLNLLVYNYLYRNQYIVTDTSLNVIYRGNTIDPVSHMQINSVQTANGEYALGSPVTIVNKNAEVFGEFLFVFSNLMAANENRDQFDKSSVIDVYDLSKRKYQYSFYLPDYDRKKIKSFKVIKNKLFAIYDRYVIVYSLKAHHLKREV